MTGSEVVNMKGNDHKKKAIPMEIPVMAKYLDKGVLRRR
jgi:hypothetical protein